MTPSRNSRIRELFDAAVGKSAEDQAELLWRECGNDEELVGAVWRLLGAIRKNDGFLASPAWKARPAEPALGAVGSAIGSYKVIRQLGSGGMGIVYQTVRADQVFRRVTALKVIRPDFVTDRLIAGFEQERRILGDLDHPNIARIVDGGTTAGGLPYFVMDYVDGVSIDKFSQVHTLNVAQRLSLFLQVCAATAYLHDNRVVHGDLKPSNILVTAEANAKILDFGIAHVLDRTGVPNPDGKIMPIMTPGYASPEQLRGDVPGFPSDIYSLGVVLYEILTGSKPPRPADSDVSNSATTRDPLSPSAIVREHGTGRADGAHLEKSLRGDLDCIVMKALNREPAARYPSALAFSTDINRFLTGRGVEARHGGPIYKASRYASRNRLRLGVLFVIFALLGMTGWEGLELKRNLRIREADELKIQELQNRAVADLSELPSSPNSLNAPLDAQPFGQMQMNDLRGLEEAYRVRFPEAIHIWPGKSPRRQELVDQAQDYLRQTEPLLAKDDPARRDLAHAWSLVGDVLGNPRAPNLEDRPAAAESYSESVRILEDLLKAKPEDARARQLLDRVESLAAQLRPVSAK